jgi:hypothetical protein
MKSVRVRVRVDGEGKGEGDGEGGQASLDFLLRFLLGFKFRVMVRVRETK